MGYLWCIYIYEIHMEYVWYIYIYVCIHMLYIYIYLWYVTYVNGHGYGYMRGIKIYTDKDKVGYIHTYIHPSIHTYIHTSIHPYIHPSIHTYIHTYIYYVIWFTFICSYGVVYKIQYWSVSRSGPIDPVGNRVLSVALKFLWREWIFKNEGAITLPSINIVVTSSSYLFILCNAYYHHYLFWKMCCSLCFARWGHNCIVQTGYINRSR